MRWIKRASTKEQLEAQLEAHAKLIRRLSIVEKRYEGLNARIKHLERAAERNNQ